jgi:hypothetical protein
MEFVIGAAHPLSNDVSYLDENIISHFAGARQGPPAALSLRCAL